MDSERIGVYFRKRHRVGGAEVLERIARKGMSVNIKTGSNLENERAYGNHRSAAKYRGEVPTKVATDVALGRAIVFTVAQAKDTVGLRISLVGAVEKREKLLVIHDLMFGGRATVWTE